MAMTPMPAFNFIPVISSHSGSLFAIEAQRPSPGIPDPTAAPGQRPAPLIAPLGDAIDALKASAKGRQMRLFWPLNLADSSSDNARLLEQARDLLAQASLEPEQLVLCLTNTATVLAEEPALALVAKLRAFGYLFATQDQTLGSLWLRLLHEQAPDLIGIDPFLTRGLDHDPRKRLLLTHRARLAQSLGIKVWAKEIANQAILRICQDIGCDLLSGEALAAAETDAARLACSYPRVIDQRRMRRRDDTDPAPVRAQLEQLPTLSIDAPMQQVFDLFRQHVEQSYFPILANSGRPLGLLQERDIKRFIYSSYGRELLANRALRKTLTDFLRPCPIVDINAPAELILEVYAASDHPPGVIVTEDSKYHGFLSQGALLRLIEQQNLASAREQNPLTGLPGNRQILQFITKLLELADCNRALVYFDFDHFKPFNDRYGFRHGDRMIQLFGDLLRKSLLTENAFVGHIGGDDFFAGFEQIDEAKLLRIINKLLGDFAHSAESLYDAVDRERGYIEAPSRNSLERRQLPLIRCSAAALLLPADYQHPDEIESITRRMATLKKEAKASATGLATLKL